MGGAIVFMVLVFIIFNAIFVIAAKTAIKIKKERPNSTFYNDLDDHPTKKKESKKVDEIYGDMEDVWAKYD
ncbi:MAG: hypothetical protein JXC31_03955 [Acholeplasmataceae bacterium]|nr:hypothetical protein [Acholeplasmataceae bacterium]